MIDPIELGKWTVAGKSAIDLMKVTLSLMPKGTDKNALTQKIEEAEQALKRADAKLAQELNYKLCQCVSPPAIMLWKEASKSYVCPNEECGRTIETAPPAKPARISPRLGSRRDRA